MNEKDVDRSVKFSVFINLDNLESVKSERDRWIEFEKELTAVCVEKVKAFHDALTKVDNTGEFYGQEINAAGMALGQAYLDQGVAFATVKNLTLYAIWLEDNDPNLKVVIQ
jgi:hypothetical protein